MLDENADATFLQRVTPDQYVRRLGDWNGDGYDDLLVEKAFDAGNGQDGWAEPRSTLVVIPGRGERYSGLLTADMLDAAPDGRSLANLLWTRLLGDVDGDGRADLEVNVTGDGTFVKYGGPLGSVID